ncbi:hypothetical protein P4050_16575 [Pseudomonas aeruginosa]|nr:hypothetical protein [Pseudomonas aeruginosa]
MNFEVQEQADSVQPGARSANWPHLPPSLLNVPGADPAAAMTGPAEGHAAGGKGLSEQRALVDNATSLDELQEQLCNLLPS